MSQRYLGSVRTKKKHLYEIFRMWCISGWTQYKLCEEAGISKDTGRKLKGGWIKLPTAGKVAIALAARMAELEKESYYEKIFDDVLADRRRSLHVDTKA